MIQNGKNFTSFETAERQEADFHEKTHTDERHAGSRWRNRCWYWRNREEVCTWKREEAVTTEKKLTVKRFFDSLESGGAEIHRSEVDLIFEALEGRRDECLVNVHITGIEKPVLPRP